MKYTVTAFSDVIRKCAAECGIELQEGVYVQFTGPNYETPAEIRLAQRLGWRCSWNEYSMRSYGCPPHGNGNLWNFLHYKYGSRDFQKKHLNHKEVQETADRVAKSFKELVTKVIVNM